MPRKRTDEDVQARLDRADERVKRANEELRAAKKEAAAIKRKHDTRRKIVGAGTVEKYVGRPVETDEWETIAGLARYMLTMVEGTDGQLDDGRDRHDANVQAFKTIAKKGLADYAAKAEK